MLAYELRNAVKKSFARNKWFALFVLFPTFCSVIYYGVFASDQYVSESRFLVKSQSRQSTQLPSLASIIQTSGLTAGQEQTNEVLSYIKSRSGLADLSKTIDVRKVYAEAGADSFSRYPAPWRSDHFENLYLYYSDKVTTKFDIESGLAILSARAFTPAEAQKINADLLNLSEQLVNRLNQKARTKAVSEAERRVAQAEERVKRARSSLSIFRNREELVDPIKQAGGVLDISNRFVAQQAALQAQLDVMVRAAPRNPGIPALRARIAAIGKEIAAQTGRAVGSNSSISNKLGGYEELVLEQEFAAENLVAANASLEQARNEVARQQFYLERVVEPNRPDASLLPNRIRQILTVAGASICFYMIGWMLVVGILEHAPDDH
jgi:capsular polysaccharide transport system permease protein